MAEKRVTWLGIPCHVCGKECNSWDKKIVKALGYRHMTCETCVAAEYDKTKEELREIMEDFFGMRPCQGI